MSPLRSICTIAAAGVLTSLATAADFHPIASVTTSTIGDLWPVSNLIQGAGAGFSSAEPHAQLGSGNSSRWVTDAPDGFPSDFIEQTGRPVLILDLGSARALDEISVWGYATTNANGVSRFSLRFATSSEGPGGFGTSIGYSPSFEPTIDDSARQSFAFSETVVARYVEFTCVDNFYSNGGSGPPGGGDRVGLGEIAFEDKVPNPNPIIDVVGGVDLGSYATDPGVVSQTLAIANLGVDQGLRITSATLQAGSPGAEYFSVGGVPQTIPAGQSADLTITLDAGGNEGCFNVQLDLTTNDPDRPTVSVLATAGINCVPAEPEEPVFSADSGAFTDSFELSLSSPTQGAVIVYTTDGSVPSATNGIPYTGPITIDSSTQIRAATISGEFPPAIATENYVRLAADVQAYSSALPILIVENYGAGAIPNKGWSTNTQTGAGLQQLARQAAYMHIVDRDPITGSAAIGGTPDLTSRIGIRVRGAFSSTWNPKPYSLETWKKNADDDRNVKPLGMPAESDWILYYPHPNYDRTMLYNTFIWELARETGRYGNRFRFVDVFVNENGGDLQMSDRRGVYALAEKVKRGSDRIDFEALSDDGSTGGWLLGINRMDAIPPGGFPTENGASSPQFFHTAGPNRNQQTPPNTAGQGDDIPRQYNAYINFESPNGYRINPAQRSTIEGWFREFEDVFYDDALWRDPVNGYRKYLDTRDFIDYFHLLNLAKQGDGLLISIFPWVSSGERKLHMGPMWDFNNGAYGSTTNSPLYFRRDRVWYPRLFQDPDYEREYIDRWYELRRGPLSAANMDAIIDRQAAEITPGLAAAQGAGSWSARLREMKENLRDRADWLDSQFFAPPEIGESGGMVTLSDPSGGLGTIYYTTDGSDPQPSDGPFIEETILLDQGAPATALIPSASNGGDILTPAEWTTVEPPPNDPDWIAGTTGIGYEYDGLTGLDTREMKGENASAYARIPFDLPDQGALDSWNRLTLRMKFEDGFVAYLNGTKVAEFQAPADPAWNSQATASHSDTAAVQFTDFDISPHLASLATGSNLLAIHLLNTSPGSSDLLALPQLVAAEVRVSVPSATRYDSPIALESSTTIRARILSDSGQWSAINESTFIIGTPADATNLVVSELMYHPPDTAVGAEFVELQNISTDEMVDLTGVAFTAGIDYGFPTGATLAPGERFVIPEAEFREGTRLANSGEQLLLSAADGTTIRDFTYDDSAPWPESPDGDGFSLVLVRPASNPDHNAPENWRRSTRLGGSPGASDTSNFSGSPEADQDRDGMPALLEHLFGSSDQQPAGSPMTIRLEPGGGLLIDIPRNAGAEDIEMRFESSHDLTIWSLEEASLERVETGSQPREIWRLAPSSGRRFLRIRVDLR
ncbi:MAG: CotH kinase family protein [Verrucomicrobiales bacterium]